jgi:hypothetical protein
VVTLMRLLAEQQAASGGVAGSDDWWSAIVFVETKVREYCWCAPLKTVLAW